MSLLYTTHIVSWQAVAAGHHLQIKQVVNAPGGFLRIDSVSYYWGSGPAALGVSAVCTVTNADSGAPTFAGYDSGPTTVTTPLQVTLYPRFVLPYVAGTGVSVAQFNVANTSPGTQTMDVCISGIWLQGGQPTSIGAVYV